MNDRWGSLERPPPDNRVSYFLQIFITTKTATLIISLTTHIFCFPVWLCRDFWARQSTIETTVQIYCYTLQFICRSYRIKDGLLLRKVVDTNKSKSHELLTRFVTRRLVQSQLVPTLLTADWLKRGFKLGAQHIITTVEKSSVSRFPFPSSSCL